MFGQKKNNRTLYHQKGESESHSVLSTLCDPMDRGNRLLEGTDKTLYTPGPRRKEQWSHKRLSQTCCEYQGVSNGGMGRQCPATGSWALNTTVLGALVDAHISPFEEGRHYCYYPYHYHYPCQTTGREHSPTSQQKIGLKIYWAWSHPSDSPTVSPSHQEASTSFLSLSIIRADRMKTTITENKPNWSHGSQPCLTQWNYEPCHVSPPKMDGSWWRVLIKCGPLEKGMANRFSFLSLRTPWTVWKGKKIWHWKINFLVSRYPYATGEEWRYSSGKNEDAEPKQKQHPVGCYWWWKSDAVKNNIS